MNKENSYNNSGALFTNDHKNKDTHPDYQGSATVNGEEYWISSWIKVSSSGRKFMSIAFNLKQEVHKKGLEEAQKAINSGVDSEYDIPF